MKPWVNLSPWEAYNGRLGSAGGGCLFPEQLRSRLDSPCQSCQHIPGTRRTSPAHKGKRLRDLALHSPRAHDGMVRESTSWTRGWLGGAPPSVCPRPHSSGLT